MGAWSNHQQSERKEKREEKQEKEQIVAAQQQPPAGGKIAKFLRGPLGPSKNFANFSPAGGQKAAQKSQNPVFSPKNSHMKFAISKTPAKSIQNFRKSLFLKSRSTILFQKSGTLPKSSKNIHFSIALSKKLTHKICHWLNKGKSTQNFPKIALQANFEKS